VGYEYKTKEGLPIKFKVYEQDPQDSKGLNLGWVVHRVEAWVDDMEVGYLKISYIPQSYADKWFPTLWHYLKNHKGYRNIKDPDDLDSVYRGVSISRYSAKDPESVEVPEKKVRDKQLRMFLKTSPEAEDYKSTMLYLVDHPFVDYINVEFKGQGIGTALYKYGARWLAKTKGLPLYASSLQTEEAKSAWLSMRKPSKRIPIKDEPHPTDPTKTRTKIDYRQMGAALANHYLASGLLRMV